MNKSKEMLNPPENIFSVLGNDTRMEILWAVWDAYTTKEGVNGKCVTFSELRERVGTKDSGQFNYHLNKLVGKFINRTEDGYELNMQGWSVIGAILSGAYADSEEIGPVEVDSECTECGSGIEAVYRDERVTIQCSNTECGDSLSNFYFPPGSLPENKEDLPLVADKWVRSQYSRIVDGFCANCEGRMVPELIQEKKRRT